MKILNAIALQDIIEKGGSTYPWVVLASEDETNIAAYVVKIFTTRQIEQQNAVAKEVFGNVLAKAFDLPVPDMALFEFDSGFIETLSAGQKQKLSSADGRLKFGSKLAHDYTLFDPGNLSSGKIKHYDIGSVFAFDNLVWNLDRGGMRKKPNILVNDLDFLLIDHEQIFPFADDPESYSDQVLRDFRNRQWNYRYENHLFFPFLKKMRMPGKQEVFETFHEYLRTLNLNLLDEPAAFLRAGGHPVGNLELIKDYLAEVKQRSSSFMQLLQSAIS